MKDLIEGGKCICGRDIREGEDEHDCLMKLLEKSFSSELESTVINVAGSLRALRPRLVTVPAEVRELIRLRFISALAY